jgi:serine/threonine protein kinase
MQQLLQGLAAVQAANISHRDVKPENLLVRPVAAAAPAAAAAANNVPNTEQLSQQQASNHSSSSSSALPPDPLSLHLRLIDFGSALDPVSMASGLYGRPQATVAGGGGVEGGTGPSLDELTLEYAPPEVIFSSR